MRPLLLASTILLFAAADASRYARAEDPPLLANASFEDGEKMPSSWERIEGARDGETGQSSEIALDRETVRHGKSSLRLSGGGGTTSWQLVRQRVAVKPGQRLTFTVASRSVNVRKEGRQYPNANALLEILDATGQRVQMLWTPTLLGTHDWTDVRVSALVPDGAAVVWAGLFLSQSGTLWFDDVRLVVAPANGGDPAGRAAAFDAVEGHLRATYPFFGLAKKPMPDALFGTWRERCLAAKDEEGFFRLLRQMLAELDDLHVWLRRGGKPVATAVPSAARPNFDAAIVRAALTEVVDEKPPLLAGRIGTGGDAIGYVAIGTWQMDEPTAARLDAALDALAGCGALVLDVRANAGGDESIAQKVAARFTASDVVYARSVLRDPFAMAPDAFLAPVDRVLSPKKGAKPDPRKVAVLQGRHCMSSCEGFLLMARALPTVTTVGVRSRGASANPKPFPVFPDLVLWSSTWRALPPSGDGVAGETIEGRGVEPEVEVKEAPADGKDPVLAKALEILRS